MVGLIVTPLDSHLFTVTINRGGDYTQYLCDPQQGWCSCGVGGGTCLHIAATALPDVPSPPPLYPLQRKRRRRPSPEVS